MRYSSSVMPNDCNNAISKPSSGLPNEGRCLAIGLNGVEVNDIDLSYLSNYKEADLTEALFRTELSRYCNEIPYDSVAESAISQVIVLLGFRDKWGLGKVVSINPFKLRCLVGEDERVIAPFSGLKVSYWLKRSVHQIG